MNATTDLTKGIVKWAIQIGIFILIMAVIMFISSGHLAWRGAWAYLAVLVASQLITALFLIPHNPELLGERAKLKEGPRNLDRVLAGIMALYGPFSILIVAGLDTRLAWSPRIAPALWGAALVVIIAGSLLTIWAMAANKFFYGTVRVEHAKGHTTMTGGPYQYVRHPGYMGTIIFNLAAPLVLGSIWAFIPALLTICATVVRTALEDEKLREELDGYREYAARKRYRLVPGLW